jgi:hypothetical protein
VAVEERVVEQEPGGVAHQTGSVGAGGGKRILRAERLPDVRGRFAGRHQPVGQRGQSIGNLIDEAMADLAKLARLHVERRPPLSECFQFRCQLHLSPSNKSDSRAAPPLTLLKTR